MCATAPSPMRTAWGNKGRTAAGDVQVMSAGGGLRHAEYNREPETTRIFQIWIEPDREGGEPSWGAKPFPKDGRAGKFAVLASGFEEDRDALPIRAEARVLGATLRAGETVDYAPAEGRHLYLVPASGAVEVNGVRLNARDGAAIAEETRDQDHGARRFRAHPGRRGLAPAFPAPKAGRQRRSPFCWRGTGQAT